MNLTKIALAIVIGCFASMISAQNTKPFIIPEIKEWTGKIGVCPTTNTRIVYNAKQAQLSAVAQQLSNDFLLMFGKKPEIISGKSQPGDIELKITSDKKLKSGGYKISITDKVVITANEPTDIFMGTRTLLQIAEQNDRQELPKGEIVDFPDYEMRGFMLDCARKYIPLDYLRDLVKIMAYYKMNTLQIHLNDNAFKQYYEHNWDKTYSAFRLESDTYPGLAAKDGHYTKNEFRDFQKEAMKLGVEIIPEIDVPAHSLAFTQYNPAIGSKKYGMDHLDLFAPETYTFVDNLFKEYIEGDDPVFVSKKVHIGTDEYSNEKPELIEKFRYFTNHYINFVEKYGKQACVWGALTHANGNTPVKAENVIMSLWNTGFAKPADMIQQGYKLVSIPDHITYIVPLAPYYHDFLDLKELYANWTPAVIGKEIFQEKHPSILGGMFALWNDHAGNGVSVKDLHYRIYPSLQVFSTKMWTGKNVLTSFDDFNAQRNNLSEAPGVNQSGKLGKTKGLVFEKATIVPGSESGVTEVGYDYTVEFNIEGKKEAPGTVLFQSPNATFYLSDPIKGLMGFSRDGYLNTFRYSVNNGDKIRVRIEGDHLSTRLLINDRLVDDLQVRLNYYNSGRDSMKYISTLVFPLQKAGEFKSKVKDLKVYNFRKN